MNSQNQISNSFVCFGEILWDVLPAGAMPGGAPMNVAYHLKKLNHEPRLITRIGHDKWGKDLIHLMERSNISTDYFQMDHQLETGKVIANVQDAHNVTYDILAPVAWDNIQWEAGFDGLLQESDCLIFGSLSARNGNSRDTLFQLISGAKRKVLDINLRPPHFEKDTVKYLMQKADILKLNFEELELITGWFTKYSSEQERMKQLQEHFKIPTIIVTKGADGCLLLHEGKFFSHAGFRVKVADTIGSGDAFLAGFLSYMAKENAPQKALEYANALGALIATYNGACPDYDEKEIEQVLRQTMP